MLLSADRGMGSLPLPPPLSSPPLLPLRVAAMPPATASRVAPAAVAGTFILSSVEPPFPFGVDGFERADFERVPLERDFDFDLLDFDLLEAGFRLVVLELLLRALLDRLPLFEAPFGLAPELRFGFGDFVLVCAIGAFL